MGVVTSPGIELAVSSSTSARSSRTRLLGSVFGTRKDLKEKFGSDAIHLIQVGLDPKVDDQEAVQTIQRELFDAGLLDAGSGRFIKTFIGDFAKQAALLSSVVGIFAMLIACMGVANLVIAGIEARKFEFEVLRAIGGSRGVIAPAGAGRGGAGGDHGGDSGDADGVAGSSGGASAGQAAAGDRGGVPAGGGADFDRLRDRDGDHARGGACRRCWS